jgi:hypothetical protein
MLNDSFYQDLLSNPPANPASSLQVRQAVSEILHRQNGATVASSQPCQPEKGFNAEGTPLKK